MDLAAFRAADLRDRFGVNVLLPVLPLHGPRRIGRLSGDGFFGADIVDMVHAEAQAMWDLRRWLGWIRAQGGSRIGVYGLSLGGYNAALLACLDAELATQGDRACVVLRLCEPAFVHQRDHHRVVADAGAVVAQVFRAMRIVERKAFGDRLRTTTAIPLQRQRDAQAHERQARFGLALLVVVQRAQRAERRAIDAGERVTGVRD